MYKLLKSRLYRPLTLSLIVCATLGFWGTRGQQKKPLANDATGIENNIQSLVVVPAITDANETRSLLKLKVTNVSKMNVTAYAFLKKDGSTLTTDGATTGWALAPGGTDVVTLSADTGEGAAPSLHAVLFEDGTGEGDLNEVSRMRDYRIGIAKQFERAIPLLNKVNSAPESVDAEALLDELQNELAALPEEAVAQNVSPGMASGIQHAKQFVLSQIKQSKEKIQRSNSPHRVVKDDVSRVLSNLERARTKIHKPSEPDSSLIQR